MSVLKKLLDRRAKQRLCREFAFRFLYQRDALGMLGRRREKITKTDFMNFIQTAEDDFAETRASSLETAEDSFAKTRDFLTTAKGGFLLKEKLFEKLARGTCERIEEIDSLIEKCADNWKISRMSPVDVNIMRVAVYEIAHMSETDSAVSINEAVEIARKYGAEKSGAFINGVLDKIANGETAKNV